MNSFNKTWLLQLKILKNENGLLNIKFVFLVRYGLIFSVFNLTVIVLKCNLLFNTVPKPVNSLFLYIKLREIATRILKWLLFY